MQHIQGFIRLSYLYRKKILTLVICSTSTQNPAYKRNLINEFLQSPINKREFIARGEKAQDDWRSQGFALLYTEEDLP